MPPNTQLLLLALTHWLWLSTRMYNFKKRLHFFGEKNRKKNRVISITLPRLRLLQKSNYSITITSEIWFRSNTRLRLLQKSDFARFLDYDYFRKLRCTRLLDYDYFRKLRCARLLDYDLRLLQKTTLRSITRLRFTITSKKSSQPIWPSLYHCILYMIEVEVAWILNITSIRNNLARIKY